MNFHLCDLIVTLNIIPDIFHFNNINGTKSKEHRPSLVFHCNSRERDVPTQFCWLGLGKHMLMPRCLKFLHFQASSIYKWS